MRKYSVMQTVSMLIVVMAWGLAASSLLSCTNKKSVRASASASAGASEANSGGSSENADPSPTASPDLCQRVNQACDTVGPRMFCELAKFPGHVVNDGHRVHAYANGECESKRLVLAEACSRGWDIKTMDAIQCQPDATNGECPLSETICTAEYQPHSCAAKKYAGAVIDSGDPLVGWGANLCHANLALENAACGRNKSPKKLAEKSCAPLESFAGDCPQTESLCQVTSESNFECVTQLKDEAGEIIADLVGSGGSECAARAQLNQKVCVQGRSPAEVSDGVVCRKI